MDRKDRTDNNGQNWQKWTACTWIKAWTGLTVLVKTDRND